MAKYSKMERFGITVILILLIIIVIGVVFIFTKRGTEKVVITEDVKKVNQQLGESIQETLIKDENKEEVEFSASKQNEEIKSEEYNKKIDKSKPVLVF